MSGFLIDTNLILELTKPSPAPRVTAWLDGIDEQLFYLSVLTFGEARRGISLLLQSKRRARLEAWLSSDLPTRFAGRILDVDQQIADRWGPLSMAQEDRHCR